MALSCKTIFPFDGPLSSCLACRLQWCMKRSISVKKGPLFIQAPFLQRSVFRDARFSIFTSSHHLFLLIRHFICINVHSSGLLSHPSTSIQRVDAVHFPPAYTHVPCAAHPASICVPFAAFRPGPIRLCPFQCAFSGFSGFSGRFEPDQLYTGAFESGQPQPGRRRKRLWPRPCPSASSRPPHIPACRRAQAGSASVFSPGRDPHAARLGRVGQRPNGRLQSRARGAQKKTCVQNVWAVLHHAGPFGPAQQNTHGRTQAHVSVSAVWCPFCSPGQLHATLQDAFEREEQTAGQAGLTTSRTGFNRKSTRHHRTCVVDE